MYPTSMRINEEGRLEVNFKTEARFRGQFVMSHPGNTHTHTRNTHACLPDVVVSPTNEYYITSDSISSLSSISGDPN